MAVDLYFNRCPQVGGGSHGFGSELIDDMTLWSSPSKRDDSAPLRCPPSADVSLHHHEDVVA